MYQLRVACALKRTVHSPNGVGCSSTNAHVAELVDAHGSGPCAARCGGSSPSVGTIYWKQIRRSMQDRRVGSLCPRGRLSSNSSNQCPRGGIGRRARFRSVCRKVWGFESLRGHQSFPDESGAKRRNLCKRIAAFCVVASILLPRAKTNSAMPRQNGLCSGYAALPLSRQPLRKNHRC